MAHLCFPLMALIRTPIPAAVLNAVGPYAPHILSAVGFVRQLGITRQDVSSAARSVGQYFGGRSGVRSVVARVQSALSRPRSVSRRAFAVVRGGPRIRKFRSRRRRRFSRRR